MEDKDKPNDKSTIALKEEKQSKEPQSNNFISDVVVPNEIVHSLIEDNVPVEITRQDKIEYLTVDVIDWERIENHISQLKSFSSIYQNIFWASIGLLANAIFALVSLYSVEQISEKFIRIAWAILTGSIVAAAFSAFAAYREKQTFETSITLIKYELSIIKNKNRR